MIGCARPGPAAQFEAARRGTGQARTVTPRPTGARATDARARDVMARVARTFDLAVRLLPGDLRRDVRRLYLVLRTLDDLADHAGPDQADQGQAGARVRIAQVERWARGSPADGPEAAILADLADRYPGFPRDAVADLCAGLRTDLDGARLATDADLERYCYCVAGTVGRMMAALLGVVPGHEAEADRAARALGAAMQRTNILRDIVEDASRGRVYLPATRLAAHGIAATPATLAALARWDPRARAALLREQIALADADYATGLAGIRLLQRGRWAVAAAAVLYREILRQIERDGLGRDTRRAVVPRRRKLALLVRLPRALA